MNQSVFVGRLTHDIELSKSQSGVISTRFTLAVPRKGSKETTDFIPCVAFGKTAELIDQLTKKGSRIGVEGHWQSGKYMDKNNKDVYTLDCYVDYFQAYDYKEQN